jgi:hypothetical protein
MLEKHAVPPKSMRVRMPYVYPIVKAEKSGIYVKPPTTWRLKLPSAYAA